MCAEIDPGEPRLAILAKAPLPGQVMTRLIPALGAEQAAHLHERLLRLTVDTARHATTAERITLWTALDHEHPLFIELASRYGITLRRQAAGDLGARMYQALARMGEPGLVIGSDCPSLTPALLRQCQQALRDADAVCLPAEDGGYGLIGMRRAERAVFDDIAWGTDGVMAATRQRIATLGWRLACPAQVWDVDRPDDVARWLSSQR